MIAQEIVEIWHHIIGALKQHLWYIADDTDDFLPSLRVAISLDERQYGTLLLRSGIEVKRRGLYGINTDPLDYLRIRLRRQHDLRFTTTKSFASKSRVFISIGEPTFQNPSVQAKADPRVLPHSHGNGLDEERVQLLERLCAERASTDEPELIVDEQLPPPPHQIEQQHEQQHELPAQADVQRPRPARDRRVFQEIQVQASPQCRTRTRRRGQECSTGEEARLIVNEPPIRNEPPQEEAQQARPHRERVDLPITMITNVFNRIPIVQNLIVEHRGDNDLVETRRGMIHAPPED